MNSRFEKLIPFVLDNLFDVATIIVAGALVVRYQISAPTQSDIPEIATWVLAVLGLMAVSGIWERNRRLSRIEKVGEETKEFAKQYVNGVIPANRFFVHQKLHQLSDNAFLSSQTIDVAGITLARTTREYMSVYKHLLGTGTKVRIIICDSKNPEVVNQIALRNEGDFPPSFWKERLLGVESSLGEIAKVPHKRGAMKVGFLPYVPAFGLLSIDAHKPQGLCYVEIYHHKTPDPCPAFEIHRANDPTWHEFFAQQFEILWASCRIETL